MYLNGGIIFEDNDSKKKVFGEVLVSDVFENNNTFKACIMVSVDEFLGGFEIDDNDGVDIEVAIMRQLSECDTVSFNVLEFGTNRVVTFKDIIIDCDFCVSNCARVYIMSDDDWADEVINNSYINKSGNIEQFKPL